MDKNEAMVKFLMNCPTIQENPLFFNFADVESGNNHFITEKDTLRQRYIDGSMLKQYTFSIASYSSVSHNAIVNGETIIDENMENMAKVQEILDWINEESELAKQYREPGLNPHYPDFGEDCIIDDMITLTSDPDIDGIDTSVNPPIARYSVGVKLVYLDKSKVLFGK